MSEPAAEDGAAVPGTASGPRAAVLGGTGFLGRRVVAALAGSAEVTLAARHPEAADDALPAGAPIRRVRADIRDRGSLDAALAGAGAAVNCVSLYRERGDVTFEEIHVRGARRWAEAAAAAGVGRLILVSGIGADPGAGDAYVRSRGEGEEAVREVFPGATIVRPSVMFGRDGAFFGELDRIVRWTPAVPLFGDGRTRLQPVYVRDVAAAIARIATADEAPLPLYELGGPHIYAYREIVERLAEKADRRRAVLPMPFAVWHGLAAAGRLLPSPPITPGQVALMRKDNLVGRGGGTFADLGIEPRSAESLGLI